MAQSAVAHRPGHLGRPAGIDPLAVIEVVDDNIRPGLVKQLGGRQAKSLGGSGDDGGFAGQVDWNHGESGVRDS